MGALTHNGDVLQGLPANASQINFDKTGTDLNSTQVENAIKEVNTKVNANTDDITQLKSGLTNVQGNMTNVLTGSAAMQSDHDVHEAVLTRNGMIYAGFFNMTLTSAVSAWTPFAHVEANLKYTTLCYGPNGDTNNHFYCTKVGDIILTQPADTGTQIHIVLVGVADFT